MKGKMSDVKLGQVIEGQQHRDAIHVAITPVTCKHVVRPGQHLGLVAGSVTEVTEVATTIGIADPFLNCLVTPGRQFWLLLYPQTITSLRHEWTHPSFAAEAPAPAQTTALRSESQQWIREFAEQSEITYRTLMDGAKDWLEDGEYLCLGGLLEGASVPDEFWTHYENVTGAAVTGDKRESFFSCSC